MSSKSSQGKNPGGFQWTPDKIIVAVLSARSLDVITREEARDLLTPFFALRTPAVTGPSTPVDPVPVDPADDATVQGRC